MSDHTFIEDPENSSCLVCSDPDNQEGGLSSSIAPAEHWRQLSRLFGLLTGDEPLQRRIVIFKAWQNIAGTIGTIKIDLVITHSIHHRR